MNSKAAFCVKILLASCTEGFSISTYVSFLPISRTICSTIDLSEITPNARMRINNGTGFRTLGTFTTIFPKEYFAPGTSNCTDMVLTGLETSSDTDRIEAEYVYILVPLSLILIILLANCS